MRDLIEAGADANQIGKSGLTPLYMAIKGNYIECVRLLIARGA
jgi:ankyrin repeat protein